MTTTYRTCPRSGLQFESQAEKLMIVNAVTAVVVLLVGGILAIGVVLCAAALRAVIEAGALLALLLRPGRAIDARRWLEGLGLTALYLGLPAWLLLRVFAN